MQKFLLFKIVFESVEGEPEAYLGITGPYPAKAKKIVTESEAAGLYTDEFFDVKKIDKHFKLFIEQQEKYLNESNDELNN